MPYAHEPKQQAQAPTIAHGARGAREEARRAQSVTALAEELAAVDIEDVLKPDVFTVDDRDTGSSAWLEECTGLSDIVRDEAGTVVDWPWESPKQRHTGGKRRRHRLDAIIMQGLMHSTASGDMGANSTGVRKWKAFTASMGMTPHRPMDTSAPLAARLQEEWLCMRFIAALVEDGGVLPTTAASYFGQVQGWHAKEHGVKLAAGIKLNRLPAMVKGLRRVVGEGGRAVRRGIAPQALRRAMDACLDPDILEHAYMRASLSLALQGLLRGAEFAVDGKFNPLKHMTRADLVSITDERLVVMMRPCKNMQHLSGKTVPLIIGAGGGYVDAVREIQNLVRLLGPCSPDAAAFTPLFQMPSGRAGEQFTALTTQRVREWTRTLMASIGEQPAQFGTHSYRIGGATALFAAGADPTIIRTMGRWSSDCYRLYVRACFGQTLEWSRRCGSQMVSDVAAEFEEVDSY